MILFGNKNLISAQIYTLLIPNGNKKKRFIMNSQDLTTMKDIGKLIRDIRKQQGVTQEELVGIPSLDTRFVYPSHLRAFFRE